MTTVTTPHGLSSPHPLHPVRVDRVTGLLPEMAVVLATVRGDVEGMAGLLKRFGVDLHWPLLVALAQREMATPVLHGRLQRLGSDGSGRTAEELGHLGRLAMVHEFRILEMERRLGELLDAYEEERIHVLLLKGAALWHTAYSRPSRRPMGDVDLLVEPDRAKEAWELARVRGWGKVVASVPMEAFDDHQHMARLYDDSGLGLGLEIHTDLFPERSPFRLPSAEFWTHAQPLPDRECVHIPAPRHLLLHNCLHFAWSHAFGYGAWKAIRDTDALLTRGRVDLERFVTEAREARAASCAFWTLHLAAAWSDVPVPPEVMEGLGRPVPHLAMAPLRRHLALALTTQPEHGLPVGMGHVLWEVAIRPGSSGHGAIRPWSDSDKWAAAATDPDGQAHGGGGADPGSPPGWDQPSTPTRVRTAMRHVLRLATGR